jgi:urea transport system substrate-binding protein
MEAAYVSVYRWKNTVAKARSFAVADIQKPAGGVTVNAQRAWPQSTVTTTTS